MEMNKVKLVAKAVSVEEILPWRDLYRQEMNCQIVCDSLDSRKGCLPTWTRSPSGALLSPTAPL